TIRVRTGGTQPSCEGNCPEGYVCEETYTHNPDGTVDVCCNCVPEVCEPTPDGSACKSAGCTVPESCRPICASVDPVTGDITVENCQCKTDTDCSLIMPEYSIPGCIIPDNGSGSANMPPVGCEYISPDERWMIIDGLPPGTTIEFETILKNFLNVVINSGGSLGGYFEQFDATLDMTVTGTGELTGFDRHISVPLTCETHSGPRSPGNPEQSFATDFFRLNGELFGDPDFCTFRVTGGTDNGLPGPGQTDLMQLPDGDYAAESFFDITYQIEFEGCPASVLEGYSGVTTGTIRIMTGAQLPTCSGICSEDDECSENKTVNPDGTIQICCECVPQFDCDCVPGDPDTDPAINLLDILYLIDYVYGTPLGPAPQPYDTCSGDPTCDCVINLLDILQLIAYIYTGEYGDPPNCTCEDWITACGEPLRRQK
ncbi:MAG: hypothetical protein JSV44_09445, partial [Candidatus Zixiibacteriota bacterium]